MSSLLPLELPPGLNLPPEASQALNERLSRIAEELRKLGNASTTVAQTVSPSSATTGPSSSTAAPVTLVAAATAGFQKGVIADRPSGSNPGLYYATDWEALYGSNGSGWIYLAGAMQDLFANRPATLGAADTGFLFYATDRTILFEWSGSAWTWQSGTMRDVFSNRPTPGASEAGELFYATDRTVLYQWDGSHWNYQTGTMQILQANVAALAATLGAHDAGMLLFVSDYAHMLAWTGSALSRGPGDLEHSDSFHFFAVQPTDVGWLSCNGASVSYLKYDGTLGTRTLPNTANAPAYLNAGFTYAPGGTAAATPTIGGSTASSITGASIPATTGNDNGAGQVVQNGTGTTVAAHTHTHNEGSLTDPGHTHAAGTLAVMLPGDPIANFGALMYYRQ